MKKVKTKLEPEDKPNKNRLRYKYVAQIVAK